MSVTRRFVESVKRGTVRRDIKGHIDTWRHDHRRIAPNPEQACGTVSSARINQYADVLPAATFYLEIGVEHGYTLEAVKLSTKVGVDPHPAFSLHFLPPGLDMHPTTSDLFFTTLSDDRKFDIIFLDGLHTYQQTYRDLINSLRHLVPRGVVIIDDVVPSDEVSSMPDLEASIKEQLRREASDFRWHGDVFRMIPLLRDHHRELHYRTVAGSGNEQLILWKTNDSLESIAVDEVTLQAYSALTYAETFENGIPTFFLPGSDEEIRAEFQTMRQSE